MVINLSPGDELVVRFQDTDGEFRIHFDSKTHPNAIVVEETMGFPDDEERKAILYKETFSNDQENELKDGGRVYPVIDG